MSLRSLMPFVLACSALACSSTLRDADTFRADTGTRFTEKVAEMRACYDDLQKTRPGIRGTVTVSFTWEHETGALQNLAVDPTASNAPEAVNECVRSSLSGLILAPADPADGKGRWRFDFTPPAPVAPAAPVTAHE